MKAKKYVDLDEVITALENNDKEEAMQKIKRLPVRMVNGCPYTDLPDYISALKTD